MLKVRKDESPLHCLHLRLCEWPAGLIAAEMTTDPRFAAWIRQQLRPELLEFVLASPRHERLLEQPELRELADVVDDGSCAENALAKFWTPAPLPGYLDYRVCIGEIAGSLGLEVADDFARRCAKYVSDLETRRMTLSAAIETIAQWIEEIEDVRLAVEQFRTPQVADSKALDADQDVFHVDDAARYLGMNVKRPDNAMLRLIEKGDLPRIKINGKLVFMRAGLDRVKTYGSRRSRRGRPPGSRNQVRQV